MKKTLIALMALASVACGATLSGEVSIQRFNTLYDGAITLTNYTAGDDYTLTYTLGTLGWDNTSIGYSSPLYLVLTGGDTSAANDNWGLFTQAGQYLAFDTTSTNDRGGLTTSANSYTSSNTTTATGSLAQGTEGWFYTFGNSTNNQVGMTVTLSRADGVDSVVINKGTTAIANFTITGDTPLDASKFVFDGFNVNWRSYAATFTANGTTVIIPEPATATLSLLALVGLAARRRRK